MHIKTICEGRSEEQFLVACCMLHYSAVCLCSCSKSYTVSTMLLYSTGALHSEYYTALLAPVSSLLAQKKWFSLKLLLKLFSLKIVLLRNTVQALLKLFSLKLLCSRSSPRQNHESLYRLHSEYYTALLAPVSSLLA